MKLFTKACGHEQSLKIKLATAMRTQWDVSCLDEFVLSMPEPEYRALLKHLQIPAPINYRDLVTRMMKTDWAGFLKSITFTETEMRHAIATLPAKLQDHTEHFLEDAK